MIKRNASDAGAAWRDVLFIMKVSAASYFHGSILFVMSVMVKVLSQVVICVQIPPVLLFVLPGHVQLIP
jgi:hypothetical protein